jgi:lipopolysaccharide heptosyltransferase II
VTILLVRLRLIGDVVFTTPIIRALRRRFPDARLLYLVEPHAAPVVAANPHLSEVLIAPYSRGWRRVRDDLQLARRLRRERIDLAIDLHGGPRSALLTWASRAPKRVGYDVPGRAWMYTDIVHRPRTYRPRHAVVNQWDLLAAVDAALASPPDRHRDRVEMAVPETARAELDRTLADWGLTPADRIVVMHVSAGNPFRRWPEASFAAVASALAGGEARAAVLVTAGPSDWEAAGRVIAAARAAAPHAATRIVDAGHLSLLQLRALCDRAHLFIGGDSGPLHIAATTDVPIVAIYGPTKPERSEPWRPADIPSAAAEAGPLPCRPCDQRVCAPGDFRCLTLVTPAQVVEQATALLGVAS